MNTTDPGQAYTREMTEAIELLELGKSLAARGGYVIVISPRKQIFSGPLTTQ